MKHLFLSLLASALFGLNTFASESPVTNVVLSSFQKTFGNTKEVYWSVKNDVFKADFVYNDQYIAAYYDESGNILALTRNVLSTQLPILLENSLKEGRDGYWIADLVEYSTEEGTTYYATLENGDEKVVLKSSQNDWTVTKKVKK